MSVPTALVALALILAVIDEARARGEAWTSWAVIALAVAGLWGRF